MGNWINETLFQGKPGLGWIDAYIRGDGTFVNGHFRTAPNQILTDNLGNDEDGDGIPGFFDADADGDGLAETLDINANGISDLVDTNEDGIVDLFLDSFF